LPLFLGALAALASSACQSGGVGDPCIPEDEYLTTFGGFSETEIADVESKSFQCQTRVCLVANFRGRVSCPYGQGNTQTGDLSNANGDQACYLPGSRTGDTSAQVTVPISPQLSRRGADKAVYCSCRCAGSDSSAHYCDCPSGFVCQNILPPGIQPGSQQLAGSYCIKDGTQVTDPNVLQTQAGPPCSYTQKNCGAAHPDGL
jgi:hypothetical protein